MFEKELNSEELNKVVGTISDKHDVLSDDNEGTNHFHLEIYEQMNLIKVEDLDASPLEVRRKLDKKYGKMAVEDEINEIREEIDVEELEVGEIEINLVNNVVPKAEEFGEPSRRNTHFISPRDVPVGRTTNFSIGFIPWKSTTLKKLALPKLAKPDIS